MAANHVYPNWSRKTKCYSSQRHQTPSAVSRLSVPMWQLVSEQERLSSKSLCITCIFFVIVMTFLDLSVLVNKNRKKGISLSNAVNDDQWALLWFVYFDPPMPLGQSIDRRKESYFIFHLAFPSSPSNHDNRSFQKYLHDHANLHDDRPNEINYLDEQPWNPKCLQMGSVL